MACSDKHVHKNINKYTREHKIMYGVALRTFWLNPRRCSRYNQTQTSKLRPFEKQFSCVFREIQMATVRRCLCRQVEFPSPKLNRLRWEMPRVVVHCVQRLWCIPIAAMEMKHCTRMTTVFKYVKTLWTHYTMATFIIRLYVKVVQKCFKRGLVDIICSLN